MQHLNEPWSWFNADSQSVWDLIKADPHWSGIKANSPVYRAWNLGYNLRLGSMQLSEPWTGLMSCLIGSGLWVNADLHWAQDATPHYSHSLGKPSACYTWLPFLDRLKELPGFRVYPILIARREVQWEITHEFSVRMYSMGFASHTYTIWGRGGGGRRLML